jgi:hypothetical protein
MKQLASFLMTLTLLITVSCGSGTGDSGAAKNKTKHESDTGYTGVKSYFTKDNVKVKEIEFRNGIRNGLTRTYYAGGVLEQEIKYVDGKKNGEAKWFYPDSKLFRITPYVNDTIDGPQIQYYKSGRIKAKLDYKEGKRLPGLEEYTINGEKVTDYPTVRYKIDDQYKEKGICIIFIDMSDLSENVKFYRGDYVNGLVDLTVLTPLKQNATSGYLSLKKTPGVTADSVTVISAYLTPYGNRLYYRTPIPLPYKDLN